MSKDTTEKKSWFARHKVLTGVIGFFLLAIVLTSLSGEDVGSSTSSGSSSSGANALEKAAQKAASPKLELLSFTDSRSANFITVEGEVKNISGEKMESVVAFVSTYDENDELVTSDEALIDFNPVLAGQTSPFSVLIQYNPAIVRYTIQFKKFWGGTIETKFPEKNEEE